MAAAAAAATATVAVHTARRPLNILYPHARVLDHASVRTQINIHDSLQPSCSLALHASIDAREDRHLFTVWRSAVAARQEARSHSQPVK